MEEIPDSFYARWRLRHGLASVLQENGDRPKERLLQLAWLHQRLRRDELRLTDGRRLRVLHPGFWNVSAGPDFRGAVIEIEGAPACSGDVEIDLAAGGWKAHGHAGNPEFARVILHVVWDPPTTEPTQPTLHLAPALDAPVAELAVWLGTDQATRYPAVLTGRCANPLGTLDAGRREELLRHAALARLQRKASDLAARARQAGWEQCLWEGLLRALGYKQNPWPMQRLGELRPRLLPAGSAFDPDLQLARFFGVSGLLPAELPRSVDAANHAQLRRLWDFWWRERDSLADCVLPPLVWRLHGLRPANHPHRRLALAAAWTQWTDVPGRVERWFDSRPADRHLGPALLELLQPAVTGFWADHWTLRSRAMPNPRPLLGGARVTDLAMNVILPWLWVRAREGRNPELQAEAERRYFAWPAAGDNARLRLARQRLLGSTSVRATPTAATQQGMLQIVRDFCDHTNALCADCPFPDLVRAWTD